MPGAKSVVLIPPPTDVAAFERVYVDEHIPLALAKIVGATRFSGGPPLFRFVADEGEVATLEPLQLAQ